MGSGSGGWRGREGGEGCGWRTGAADTDAQICAAGWQAGDAI
jgi:hypothetical protein